MKKRKVLCFDLDGVLCSTLSNKYHQSKPIKKNIKLVNKLYIDGYKIKIFTARYMGRSNDNKKKATSKAKKITLNQLKLWKVKYHELILVSQVMIYL